MTSIAAAAGRSGTCRPVESVDQPEPCDWSTAAFGPQPYSAYSRPLVAVIAAPPLAAAQSRLSTGLKVIVAPPLTDSDVTALS